MIDRSDFPADGLHEQRTAAHDRRRGRSVRQPVGDQQRKIDVDPFQNPGGNAVVILIGAAAPIKMPVIGPAVPFR